MIKYKGYAITTSGEYPIINKIRVIKDGPKAGEETLEAVYFPRGMTGAFKALLRITNVDATRECKSLQDAIAAMDQNYEELIELVKGLK